jgi:hypothetical protein
MVVMLPSVVSSGTIEYRWVDPAGVTRELLPSSAVSVLVGERGLGIPGFDLMEDKLPSNPGTVLRHAATSSRVIQLPIICEAGSPSTLEALMDSVYTWFATADERARTPGYLHVTRADGTTRRIRCYYRGGLEGDLSSSVSGTNWRHATVTLVAPGAYAEDADPEVHTYTQPDFGVSLSIINTGQLPAAPIWTLTGPMNMLSIYNNTTGEAIALTSDGGINITAGDTVVIDTRPADERVGYQVQDSGGNSLFAKLTDVSTLWHFQPGLNQFAFGLAGTTVQTEIELTYYAPYRGIR